MTSDAKAGIGFTTYKSKLVESNNLSTSYNLRLNLLVGKSKILGVIFDHEINTTNFSYSNNESKIETSFNSVSLIAHWNFLSLGLLLDRSKLYVEKNNNKYLSTFSQGYGGLLIVNYKLDKQITFANKQTLFLEIKQVFGSLDYEVIDNQSYEVKIKSRSEIIIGSRFSLKASHGYLEIAYKQRNFTTSIGEKSYLEFQSTTFLGLGYQYNF